MTKRPITIEDLAHIHIVGDPQISPDGTRVLYTVKVTDVEKNKDFTHLWLSESPLPLREQGRPALSRQQSRGVEGEGAARQFTFGEVNDSSPRWSPDGETIAFFRNKDKRTQIWCVAANGGEPRALTNLPERSFSHLRWSPDGQSLAFAFRPAHPNFTRDASKKREESGKSTPPRVITRVRYRMDGAGFYDERQHIWVCDVASGKTKQITRGKFDAQSPAWAPDGKTLAFIANRSPDPERMTYRTDIWLVPARGGKVQKIETPIGPKSVLAWSPDGKHIAYLGSECGADPWLPHNMRLWVVSRKGGDARCLSVNLDRTMGNSRLADTKDESPPVLFWSADGRHLYVTVSDSGTCHLYQVNLASARMTALTDGACDVGMVSADQPRKTFALVIAEPTRPGEVFVGRLNGGHLRLNRLTNANDEWLKSVQVSKPEEFWLTQPDGTRVQGWIMRPPNFKPGKKYPLLLYVHGGPHSQYGSAFFHEFQAHAAHGYVVVYSNPRGSNGRDEAFGACIHRDWGNLDYQDVMAVADYAAALPYVDKTRMAIAGGSYGGYMTNWVVSHTNRFKCGVTDRSISNWISMVGTSDVPPPPNAYWPGNPWGPDMQKGWDMSPIKYVDQVRTPLLIIHSEGDLRCPISQAEEWYTALKWLKQEVVFVRYPRETSHGLSRGGPIDLRFDRLTRIAEWLDKYLKK